MDATVRPAHKEDIKLIKEMAEVVFRASYKDILSAEQMEYMMEWMYSETNLEKQMEEGHSFFIAEAADSGNRALGYMSIQGLHLQKLYVLPEAQGKGIGKALFETAVETARRNVPQNGTPAFLELNVNRNNKAVGFYRRQGMKILRQGDFPIGGGFYMNDYIMGLELL